MPYCQVSTLCAQERQVYEYLSTYGEATNTELRKATGIPEPRVIIARMRNKKRIPIGTRPVNNGTCAKSYYLMTELIDTNSPSEAKVKADIDRLCSRYLRSQGLPYNAFALVVIIDDKE